MIDELHIQNLALIKDVRLRPACGLTVLTGETGAGKTALLSAVKLITGERANFASIREGSTDLRVEARLIFNDNTDNDIVIVRSLDTSGRSRITLNDHMVSLAGLTKSVAPSIDICNQHEHQKLLQSHYQAQILNEWASSNILPAQQHYREAYVQYSMLANQLAELTNQTSEIQEKLDALQFMLARVAELNPQRGEYEQLQQDCARAEHAQDLMEALYTARSELIDEDKARDSASTAQDALTSACAYDETLAPLADRLAACVAEMEDVADEIRHHLDGVECNPEVLNDMQQRLRNFQQIMRSYGPRMEDVFQKVDDARAYLADHDRGDEHIRELKREVQSAHERLVLAAQELFNAQKKSAPQLAQRMNDILATLAMASSKITVRVALLDEKFWNDASATSVEFLYQSGKSLTPHPLKKIASGGEISRVMLACKVVLQESEHTSTLVFDEVDAGVGGSTAQSLARLIKKLSRVHQIIVVTHLAQLAVYADKHYVVSKEGTDCPQTFITEVKDEARVMEIARMLSGDVSDISCEHARQMIKDASDDKD
ncbi:DNA repair protein RecN [Fannyhessea vaginae]|uniref:DNA repair protein RecN n=1 Tax=Fannyhessea vaginae TaxID=82135 RepID=UPI003A804ADB